MDKWLTQFEAQLNDLTQRVEMVENWMMRLDQRLGSEVKLLREYIDTRLENQHREFFAHLNAVRSEIRTVETVTELRERLLRLEAKSAQQASR